MSNELELRQYIMIIRKRLLWISIFVVVCVAAAAVFSMYFKDPQYEAHTNIIVNQTAAQFTTGQLDLNQINTNIRMIDTYKEIIKTLAILDKVTAQYPQLGFTAEQLAKKIKVSSVNNTQMMALIVQDVDYKRAADTVNAISVVFQEEIQHIFQVENVSILNEADVLANPSPVSPNIPLNIAIAFVVSLMLAVGVVFLLEYLDDTIKSEDDVREFLGQPTLAMIARMNIDELEAQPNQSVTSTRSTRSARSSTIYKAGDYERVSIEE